MQKYTYNILEADGTVVAENVCTEEITKMFGKKIKVSSYAQSGYLYEGKYRIEFVNHGKKEKSELEKAWDEVCERLRKYDLSHIRIVKKM